MNRILCVGALVLAGCGVGVAKIENADGPPKDPEGSAHQKVSCGPQMSHFPVQAPHNIGYDAASCSSGCATSCPDQNANSDYGGVHHGVDVFAYYRAPEVSVVSGTVMRVGVPSDTSGLRVTISDGCGWWYYYGHMDEAVVSEGQHVEPGQLIGYMGSSGAPSVHLHFNVSADGDYYNDIDPFPLLQSTSATACGGLAGGLGSDGCSTDQRNACGTYGSACVDNQCNGGTSPGTGCTSGELQACGTYGSNCVDHQCNGGTSPGTGCTWRETHDCAQYAANCVDHQCNGGSAPGTGCTWRETHDCGAYGAGCVDHACNGGTAPGTGCTWREQMDCANYGAGCADHQCAGGTALGSGCTWRETHDCQASGAGCADHKCSGGTAPGTGCTFRQTLDCQNQGKACSLGACQ